MPGPASAVRRKASRPPRTCLLYSCGSNQPTLKSPPFLSDPGVRSAENGTFWQQCLKSGPVQGTARISNMLTGTNPAPPRARKAQPPFFFSLISSSLHCTATHHHMCFRDCWLLRRAPHVQLSCCLREGSYGLEGLPLPPDPRRDRGGALLGPPGPFTT